jgi:pre-mRNA cleavage complex 2 protein Pcf11
VYKSVYLIFIPNYICLYAVDTSCLYVRSFNVYICRIRLGAPTRELYVDGKWYECFFGGSPVTIDIGGKMHVVKLEGPPPQVKIGFVKRTDLVAGKINLIINAKTMVPVFLDAKPQR